MQFIQDIRHNLEMTQDDLGRVLGVTGRTVSRWESGDTLPSLPALKQLASYLGQRSLKALPETVGQRYKELQKEASKALHKAIRQGEVPTLCTNLGEPLGVSCVDCNGIATQYDHRDYLEPLQVQPVCNTCNQRRGLALWTFLRHPFEWVAFDWNGVGRNKKPRRKLSNRGRQ